MFSICVREMLYTIPQPHPTKKGCATGTAFYILINPRTTP